jgi:RNA polymerase sigma-70 factor (ECF subfamily)
VVDEVDGLPPRQKAAVYLTYWRDLPLAETAQLLGCSTGAVKRYLYLARRHLKGALGEN